MSLTDTLQPYSLTIATESEHASLHEPSDPGNQVDDLDHAEADSDGEDCGLQLSKLRLGTCGEEVLLRVGAQSKINVPTRKSHRAGLVLTREYDDGRTLQDTTLGIQSPYIIKALQSVARLDPKTPMSSSKCISLEVSTKCLFHYREGLKDYAHHPDDSNVKSHVGLCLQYMEKSLRHEIELFRAGVLSGFSPFEVDFEKLWIAYKPRCPHLREFCGNSNGHPLEGLLSVV